MRNSICAADPNAIVGHTSGLRAIVKSVVKVYSKPRGPETPGGQALSGTEGRTSITAQGAWCVR